jgi:hypothetical protein
MSNEEYSPSFDSVLARLREESYAQVGAKVTAYSEELDAIMKTQFSEHLMESLGKSCSLDPMEIVGAAAKSALETFRARHGQDALDLLVLASATGTCIGSILNTAIQMAHDFAEAEKLYQHLAEILIATGVEVSYDAGTKEISYKPYKEQSLSDYAKTT